MARSETEQANRLRKAREQRRLKHEQARDTPEAEAEAERRKQAPQEYDEDAMKKRVGNPGAALLS
jgi:hypothetical protein